MNEIVNVTAVVVLQYLLVGALAAAGLVPLAWGLIRAARIRTPVYRHMIWLYCLLGVVALPLLWVYGPKLPLAVLPARAQTRAAVDKPQPAMSETVTAPQDSPAQAMPGAPTPRYASPGKAGEAHLPSLKTALAGAWLIGFGLMVTRLGVGWYRLRGICAQATPIPPARIPPGPGAGRPTVRLTTLIHGPACFGVFRPVILLPADLYETAGPEDLRMVLAHELAHVARRDGWINLFQRLVEAVFFFHPLVWLASRQLTNEREHICDNYVLAQGASADDYSSLLFEMVEQALGRRTLSAVALFEGQLLSRVRSLLDPRRSRQTKLPRRATVACTVVILAVLFIFGSIRLTARENDGVSKDATPQDRTARVVHFPQDRALGVLEIRTVGVHQSPYHDFTPFGAARGAVEVPANRELSLIPSRDAAWDLSPLAKLNPDDLHTLYFWQVPVQDDALRHLAGLTGLQVLSLRYAPLTGPGLRHLQGLTSLGSLSLASTQVRDEGLAFLKDMQSLKLLDLGSTSVTDRGLSHLAGLRSLETLVLRYCAITDAGLESVGVITTLTTVNLNRTRVTGAGLAHLKRLSALGNLDLSQTAVDDSGLADVGALQSLKVLNLGETKVTDAGLAHLARLTNLEELYLRWLPITDAGLAPLRGLHRLTRLDLTGTKLTNEGLRHVGALTSLQWLSLPRDSGITQDGLVHLTPLERLREIENLPDGLAATGFDSLARLKSLESLDVRGPGVTDESMDYLARLPALRGLTLYRTQITDAGLARLGPLKSLRSLSLLENHGLTGAALAQVGQWPELEHLRLDGLEAGNDDLAHLTGLKRLTSFSANSPDITDAGMAHLAALTSLESVTLQNARLTDEGLRRLSALDKLEHAEITGRFTDAGLRNLQGLPRLRSFTLPGQGLTAAGLADLQRRLPALQYLGAEGAERPTTSLAGAAAPSWERLAIDSDLEQAEGRWILVCFWDMGQRPSRRFVQDLAARAKDLEDNHVAVLLIHAGDADKGAARQWLNERGAAFPTGTVTGDASKLLKDWTVQALPWLVLLDEQRIIRATGFDLAQLDENLKGGSLDRLPVVLDWRAKFDLVYRLDEGQILKRVAPPFIPERERHYQAEHESQASLISRPPDRFVFHWNGGLKDWGGSFGDAGTLGSTLSFVLQLNSYEYEGPDDLLNLALPGDWIIRDQAAVEVKLRAFERLLSEEMGRSIRFETRPAEQEVIVATGRFELHPLPDEERSRLHMYVDDADLQAQGGGGGTADSVRELLEALGDRVGMRVIDQTQPSEATQIGYDHHYSSYLTRVKDRAEKAGKLRQLLENLARQTDLQFQVETRTVEKWFVVSSE